MSGRMEKAMNGAMSADDKRKIEGLIKFASEYDSLFVELGLEGGLQQRLSTKANRLSDDGAEEGAAPDSRSATGPDRGGAREAARKELEKMKPSDLQKLARSLGVSEEDRDAAADADDPKAALVELVWALQLPAIEADEAKRDEALRAEEARLEELKGMKSSDLQKLARSLGASEEDRDAALDADDPKEALIALIVPL